MSQNNKELEIILKEINNEDPKAGGKYMTEEEMDNMINRFEKRGEQRKAIEAVQNFYKNGVSIDLIAKSMNMTTEQVKNIVADVVIEEA